MNLSALTNLASRIEWMPTTGSTNSDLVARVTASPADWPEFSVIGADFQTDGRGRAGRSWQAPTGSSLFVSVLLRPPATSVSVFGWLPLLAGLAIRDALGEAGLGERVKVKWPNDVLVDGKKIAGVLSEYVAPVSAVVIGAGVNLLQTEDQLATDSATSLSLEGASGIAPEEILAAYLSKLRSSYSALVASSFDVEASSLRARVIAGCATVNSKVRAILPGDQEFTGTAIDIDATGRLVVRKDSDGTAESISAGDIVHLRHFGGSFERIGS